MITDRFIRIYSTIFWTLSALPSQIGLQGGNAKRLDTKNASWCTLLVKQIPFARVDHFSLNR
jgi:hypothetical protein